MKFKLKLTTTIILILSIIISIYFFLVQPNITGEIILTEYTYTKAICNETNFCQDNEIVCKGEELIEVNPISGAVIQNSEEWQDPRGEQSETNLCK